MGYALKVKNEHGDWIKVPFVANSEVDVNEAGRVEAEQTRANAEQSRANAEKERANAERVRAETHSKMLDTVRKASEVAETLEGNLEQKLIDMLATGDYDGITPHIGENGHWWFADEDTGVQADAIKHTHHSNDITGIIPISKGGTGANNVVDALKNLGFEGILTTRIVTTTSSVTNQDINNKNAEHMYTYRSRTFEIALDIEPVFVIPCSNASSSGFTLGDYWHKAPKNQDDWSETTRYEETYRVGETFIIDNERIYSNMAEVVSTGGTNLNYFSPAEHSFFVIGYEKPTPIIEPPEEPDKEAPYAHLGQDLYSTGDFDFVKEPTVDGVLSDTEGYVCVTPNGVDCYGANSISDNKTNRGKGGASELYNSTTYDQYKELFPRMKYYVAHTKSSIYLAIEEDIPYIEEGVGSGKHKSILYWGEWVLRLAFNPYDINQQIVIKQDEQHTLNFASFASVGNYIDAWNSTIVREYNSTVVGTIGSTNSKRVREFKLSKADIISQYYSRFGVVLTEEDLNTMFVGVSAKLYSSSRVGTGYPVLGYPVYGTLCGYEGETSATAFIPDMIVFEKNSTIEESTELITFTINSINMAGDVVDTQTYRVAKGTTWGEWNNEVGHIPLCEDFPPNTYLGVSEQMPYTVINIGGSTTPTTVDEIIDGQTYQIQGFYDLPTGI